MVRNRVDEFHEAIRRHGSPEAAVEAVFRGNTVTSTPWGPAGYLKSERTGEGLARQQEAVAKELAQPANLKDVDPRLLRATQPSIVRAAVQHYLGGQFEQSGRTYADPQNPGNQFPVVYLRRRDESHLLLSGHHRATVALMRGQALQARLVEGP